MLFAVAAACCLSAPAAGQTELRIIVADSLTSQPVAGALIELTGPDGMRIWSGISGADGRATARVPAGELGVVTLMLGYQPVGPISIEVPDQDWLRLRILLLPAPVALGSVGVDVMRRAWPRAQDRWGFEWRRARRPFGEFLERGDERLLNAPSASSLMRRTPGFRVQDRYSGSPVVFMRGSTWLTMDGSSKVCGPTLIIDGWVAAAGGRNAPVEIDDLLKIEQIEAMEIYRSVAEVPPEYRTGPDICGALVVWTR